MAASRPAPGWSWRRRFPDRGTAVLFLLPGAAGLALFLLLPVGASLVLSFTNWQLMDETRFVGWANYVNLFTRDPVFWGVLRTTFAFSVEYLVLNIVLALGLAVWIGSLPWGRTLFRLVFFLPTFTPLVGIALIWLMMFTPGGIIDALVAFVHLPIGNLITNPATALQVLVIVSLWSHVGYNMLLFGAALDAIPSSYLDAAAIDGGTEWQRFWRIKLPLISPSLFFGTVLTAITSLQTFDQVYALTRGGPGAATMTLGYAIYNQGFVNYRMGYASASAWVLFAVILVLTGVQLRLQRAWVHYDL